MPYNTNLGNHEECWASPERWLAQHSFTGLVPPYMLEPSRGFSAPLMSVVSIDLHVNLTGGTPVYLVPGEQVYLFSMGSSVFSNRVPRVKGSFY